ncbi:hypothetical protein CS022_05960 [Veronia nyctiphanis]|uniref:Uridine kinase n=1 Tax=Veronia nyctiphanis TaxID=1278244 RepID=A0A4Q0YY67_9GAMM|nr:hypothetical protein [Veronia nyctiphanis]RXJ74159.1 hypothetical protein CS022_05960 [Veronia nyctiphanis]
MNKVKVIAISGASGSGKTSAVKMLSNYFQCPSLYFDEHVEKDTYPVDMKKWYENGANVNEFRTPNMISSLRGLIDSTHQYIFVEEPFGRERSCILPLVDYVVLLDQPIELCLSRVVKRSIKRGSKNLNSSLLTYLDNYEDHTRDIYIETVNQVRENCDLIINKPYSVEETAEIIAHWLESKSS